MSNANILRHQLEGAGNIAEHAISFIKNSKVDSINMRRLLMSLKRILVITKNAQKMPHSGLEPLKREVVALLHIIANTQGIDVYPKELRNYLEGMCEKLDGLRDLCEKFSY